jgi:hypothetical protein
LLSTFTEADKELVAVNLLEVSQVLIAVVIGGVSSQETELFIYPLVRREWI